MTISLLMFIVLWKVKIMIRIFIYLINCSPGLYDVEFRYKQL